MIEIDNLSKAFTSRTGASVVALESVTLNLAAGQFTSVVGPSGCGKTTLARIVSGLLPPSGGEVRIGRAAVEGPRGDLGMVFQSPTLLPWRTVYENIMIPIDVQHLKRSAYREKAADLIDLVGLQGFDKRYPHELSGGMQQRVSICRALIRNPEVLIMDEPFGALDALTREEMNLELQNIWLESKKTVLFITHSISEAVFLSDRVIVLSPRPGRIAADIEVPAFRPRGVDFMGSEDFARSTQQVREKIFSRTSGQRRAQRGPADD